MNEEEEKVVLGAAASHLQLMDVFNESSDVAAAEALTNVSLDYVPYERRAETYIVPILFSIIFIVGFIGNGLLIVIFLRHRNMRNVPNS